MVLPKYFFFVYRVYTCYIIADRIFYTLIPLSFLLLRQEQIFNCISFLSCFPGMGNLDISEQFCKRGDLCEKQ